MDSMRSGPEEVPLRADFIEELKTTPLSGQELQVYIEAWIQASGSKGNSLNLDTANLLYEAGHHALALSYLKDAEEHAWHTYDPQHAAIKSRLDSLQAELS